MFPRHFEIYSNKSVSKHTHEDDFETYCSRRFPDLATFQKDAQPDNANEEWLLRPSPVASHLQGQFDRRNSFSDALDASRGMVSLSQEDICPRNIYGTDNYWTHSSHPSSSASSVNSQLRYSVSDNLDSSDLASRTLPRPSAPENWIPPAPSSMMSLFSSKVSSSSQKKHKCTICDKRFTRPSSLQTHMYSHTGEKRKCD
jgi:hypothetical protein